MLKRLLMTLALCGMLASVAAAADFEFAIDTGHPNGPNWLDPGPNNVGIYITNNTAGPTPLFIGGLIFNFENSDGLLSWDLDGPDDASDPTVFVTEQQNSDWGLGIITSIPQNPNINDDGFWFEGLLDGIVDPNNPPPGNFLPPSRPYFTLHDPPQTGLELGPGSAFRVMPGATTQVATLIVEATLPPGPAGVGLGTILTLGSTDSLLTEGINFNTITELGGTERQSMMITPEPATLVLLALGGLTALRRRR